MEISIKIAEHPLSATEELTCPVWMRSIVGRLKVGDVPPRSNRDSSRNEPADGVLLMRCAKMFALNALIIGSVCHAQASGTRTSRSGPISIEEAGLKVFWEARLPLAPGESLKTGYLRDDSLYVSTDGGTFFSLHSETGLLRWGEILTDAAYTIFAPSHIQGDKDRGPVVIPTTSNMFVKDRYSGKDVVQFRTSFPTGSAAVGFKNVLIVGSTNHRVYSLAWDPARYAEPIKQWDVTTGGPVSASPVLYGNGNLLIASQSGAVFSCQATNKVLTWEYKVGGAVVGDPFVDASGAYISSIDRSLYKFHPMSGRLLWRTRFPDPLDKGPVVAAQAVFQYTPSQGITALDAMTGAEKWQIAEATQFVAHGTNGDVLFADSDRLLIVDHETGKVVSTVQIPPSISGVVNTIDDSIYLLGGGGRVHCLRLDKVPYLRRQQVLMTQETLNAAPSTRPALEPAPAPKPAPPREDPFRSRRDREPPANP